MMASISAMQAHTLLGSRSSCHLVVDTLRMTDCSACSRVFQSAECRLRATLSPNTGIQCLKSDGICVAAGRSAASMVPSVCWPTTSNFFGARRFVGLGGSDVMAAAGLAATGLRASAAASAPNRLDLECCRSMERPCKRGVGRQDGAHA